MSDEKNKDVFDDSDRFEVINTEIGTIQVINYFDDKQQICSINDEIILLPFRSTIENEDFQYAEETVNFYKIAKRNDINIEIAKITEETPLIALHSSTFWLPVIFIAENVLLPLAVAAIYDFIKHKIGKRNKSKDIVHFEIVTKNEEGQFKSIRYSGSVEGFENKFEKIDVNKLWEDS